MTIIEKALERLGDDRYYVLTEDLDGVETQRSLDGPLAALIRDVAPTPGNRLCGACGANYEHGHWPDCSLIALCEAIAGERA